jgi:2'-5' RNA ligase
MKDYGYISILFQENDVKIFKNIIANVCSQEDFYYSEIRESISGDVTAKLHLTIFYGLIAEKIDKTKMKRHLESIKLESLKLGKIFLKSGYQNLYQILEVEVLDENNVLKEIYESFKVFSYEESVQLEFKPHLTLAYVKSDYQLSKIPEYLNTIKIKEIKYFEK